MQKKRKLDEMMKEDQRQRNKKLKKKGVDKNNYVNEDGFIDPQKEMKLDMQEKDQLIFDGQTVEKSDIGIMINRELKRFMDQKLDRIRDSVPALIGRFEQNENAIKDHHSIQIN